MTKSYTSTFQPTLDDLVEFALIAAQQGLLAVEAPVDSNDMDSSISPPPTDLSGIDRTLCDFSRAQKVENMATLPRWKSNVQEWNNQVCAATECVGFTKVLGENADKCSQVVSSSIRATPRRRLGPYNYRSPDLNPDEYDLNQIPDTDLKRVETLKKIISAGNYAVPAEDLAQKLMQSAFQSYILDEAPNGLSGSQLEADDRAVPEVNDGAMINQNDSHSASVLSNVAATKRKSR